MTDDIVDDLRDWSTIIDDAQGKAVVSMLSGRIFADAADEIERLRALTDQLAEALETQCALHRVPVTTAPYYTRHAIDALEAWKETRRER